MHDLLFQLLIFCSAAIIFVPLFTRLGLSPILAYLFSGVLVGPMALRLIKDPEAILHFSEFGVIFFLFIIGLELAPERLWKMRQSIFGLGLLQVAVTGLLLMLAGLGFGLDAPAAFTAGFGLSLSSTAFAVQLLESNRQLATKHGQGAFAVLMFQDIAVVPILVVLSILSGQGEGAFTWMACAKMAGSVLAVVFIGQYAMRHVFRLIAETRIQEVFIAMSLIIVLGTAVLFEAIGLSMGMGAFIAGVLLANSEYRHELVASLVPFKGLLLGLFFIAVGMSLNLHVILAKPLIVLWVTLGFMAVKGVAVFLLARVFSFDGDGAKNIAVTICQGGEFAFVIFSVAVASKLLSFEHASILNAAVTISMALTPVVFGVNQRFFRKSSEISERPFDLIDDNGSEVVVAGFGRFGQIVGRFLSSESIAFTMLEHDAAQVETARRFGNKVYYGDASRIDILTSAGLGKAKYFVLAVDDVTKSIEIAEKVRRHFPQVEIVARARNRRHAIALMALGIESIHRETYMSSLEVAKEILLKRGARREDVLRRIELFRLHDEKILKQQFEHRNDEQSFISYTAQANAELDEILRADRSR